MTNFFDSLESRTMMAAHITSSVTRRIFSDPKGGAASATQSITITNTGTSNLTIKSGGITLTGTNASKFKLSSLPTLPMNLGAGKSFTFKTAFNPTYAGPQTAQVQVASNDPETPKFKVELRGLGTAGRFDRLEPSLQWILDTYNIPVNVGDTNVTTGKLDGPGMSDEVPMQLFSKAEEGLVSFQMLGIYSGDASVAGRFGWYEPGSTTETHELFYSPSTDVQTLNVHTVGTTRFDPGDANFGLYSYWPSQPHKNVFSEDALNTYQTDPVKQHTYRVYPMKKPDGSVVENSYVVAVEEAFNSDYQDAVFIVKNVKPAVVTPIVIDDSGITPPSTTDDPGQQIPDGLPGDAPVQPIL